MLPQFISDRVLCRVFFSLMVVICSSSRANSQAVTFPTASTTLTTANLNIITQWNFQTNAGFNFPLNPSTTIGTGTISTVGGATASQNNGTSPGPNNTNSPAVASSLNVTHLTASGNGVAFATSTVGSTPTVIVQFDIQATAVTAPNTLLFQYTLNDTVGTPVWVTASTLSFPNTAASLNFQHLYADFTGVAGVPNDPNFAIRLITNGTTAINGAGINPSQGFNIDSMTISTTPEPTTVVLAGLVAVRVWAAMVERRFRDKKAGLNASF